MTVISLSAAAVVLATLLLLQVVASQNISVCEIYGSGPYKPGGRDMVKQRSPCTDANGVKSCTYTTTNLISATSHWKHGSAVPKWTTLDVQAGPTPFAIQVTYTENDRKSYVYTVGSGLHCQIFGDANDIKTIHVWDT